MAERKSNGVSGTSVESKSSLIKSKARVKNLGEVFTPEFLVNDMLDALPEAVWEPGRTFFEPACGNGNFLVAVASRKLATGEAPLDVLRTIYAVDIMEDNVKEARTRVLDVLGLSGDEEAESLARKQIVTGDSLEQEPSELFGDLES